jgi:hypothetical protein
MMMIIIVVNSYRVPNTSQVLSHFILRATVLHMRKQGSEGFIRITQDYISNQWQYRNLSTSLSAPKPVLLTFQRKDRHTV